MSNEIVDLLWREDEQTSLETIVPPPAELIYYELANGVTE